MICFVLILAFFLPLDSFLDFVFLLTSRLPHDWRSTCCFLLSSLVLCGYLTFGASATFLPLLLISHHLHTYAPSLVTLFLHTAQVLPSLQTLKNLILDFLSLSTHLVPTSLDTVQPSPSCVCMDAVTSSSSVGSSDPISFHLQYSHGFLLAYLSSLALWLQWSSPTIGVNYLPSFVYVVGLTPSKYPIGSPYLCYFVGSAKMSGMPLHQDYYS
eukprot:Gb_22259 [translate_table: standard]